MKVRVNFLFIILLTVVVGGMMGCVRAVKVTLDPESRDFYETAQLIMTKEEKSIFQHLPDMKPKKEFIRLGIKFVDTDGIGHFTVDPTPWEMGGGIFGSLFDAIETAKLGVVTDQGDFIKKYVNFDVQFNSKRKEIFVSIPVKSLTFIEEEGLLKAEFEFEFYIYEKDGREREIQGISDRWHASKRIQRRTPRAISMPMNISAVVPQGKD